MQRPSDLDLSSAIDILQSMRSRTVVIVCDCALYRDAQLASRQAEVRVDGATLEEDIWVPHVHLLAERGTAIATQKEAYVIFDVGQCLPLRVRNNHLLKSVDPCGLMGVDSSTDPMSLVPGLADEWIQHLRKGRSDLAMASIDGLPEALNRYKPRIKAQVLYQAGCCAEAVEIVRAIWTTNRKLDPNLQVQFARFAVAGGDLPLARDLLVDCLPRLTRQEKLEQALTVALSLRSIDLQDECLRRLEVSYPASTALRERRIWRFLRRSEALGHGEALDEDLARKPTDVVDLQHAFVDAVAADDQSTPNYVSIVENTTSRWPTLVPIARIACGIHAFAGGWPEMTLACVWPSEFNGDPSLAGYASDLLLEAFHRVLLKRSADFDPTTLFPAVTELVRFLAHNPQDASRRVALARLLAVQTAGEIGLPLTLIATLMLSERPVSQSEATPIDTASPGLTDEGLLRIYRSVLEWADSHSPLALGQVRLPAELIEESADEFIHRLQTMAEIAGQGREGDVDFAFLEQIVVVAALAAPHALARRNDDFHILRFAAGRFAQAGRHQKARDFAEQALHLAGDDPLRARLAWYTFADLYHRVNNLPEALLGMACALACETSISKEQAWYETNGLIRMLRDFGMVDHALELIPKARTLLEQMGKADRFSHRLETLELNLYILALKGREVKSDALRELAQAIVQNYHSVSAARDELVPVTMTLAQAFLICEAHGLPVELGDRAILDEALSRIPSDVAALIRITSQQIPSPEDVFGLAQRLTAARYSDGIGFDVRLVVVAAERLLSSSRALEKTSIAAFAIEMMTDHSITAPGSGEATNKVAGHWMASSLEAPAAAAVDLSKRGIDVALVGLDDRSRLVHVLFRPFGTSAVVREEPSTFSIVRFRQWAERFPYGYNTDDPMGNIFYTSLQGVGTTLALQNRALLVMATPLQELPPNLVMLNGELAGRTIAMASTPSLAWLHATPRASRPAAERRRAWIPTAEDDGERRGTLSMVAERLEYCLLEHNVPLDTRARIPDDLNHSDLVVVAAHGRVGPGGNYFQSIADDDALRISPISLANALAHSHVVVLFVCSGGRADKHPFASTITGLPKELLDRSCSAVVASPWPLDARVPSHWLPAFLKAWDAGVPLIDANFQANRAVECAMGDSPALCLAMNVYGDPLATVGGTSG